MLENEDLAAAEGLLQLNLHEPPYYLGDRDAEEVDGDAVETEANPRRAKRSKVGSK